MAGRSKKSNKENFEKIKKEMAAKKKKAQEQQESANPDGENKVEVSMQAGQLPGKGFEELVETVADSSNGEKNFEKPVETDSDIADKKEGTKNSDTDKIELVVFQVDEEQFALRISNVNEIIRIPEITKVPELPNYVLGFCNLRGNLLPVIDCRKLLGLNERELNESSRVIVANINGRNVGLVSDRVLEVINVEEASVKAPPASVKGIQGGIDGILVLDEGRRVVMILNAEKVIKEENYEMALNTGNKPLEDLPVSETKLDEEQIVIFNIGSAEYAFNIDCVREIIRLPEITKVPNTASYIEGVHSIRDQLMAVINLGKLLGVNLEKPDENSRVIIIDSGNLAYGVIVDKVSQVVRVPRDSFKDIGMESGLNGADCVKGFFNFDNGNRLVMLLDPGKLISVEDIKAVFDTGHQKDESVNPVLSANADISHQYVVFKLCDEEYGIDINNVHEVNRISGIARFPGAPEFIDGMTDLRGELIPILNLRKLFSVGESRQLENSKLLVAEFENRKIGIMIDSVSGVLKFSGSNLEDALNTLHGYDQNRYIKKIAKLNDGSRIVLILDLSTLLSFM